MLVVEDPPTDLHSLAASIPRWCGDLVIADGDLVTHPDLVRLILTTPGSSVVLDTHRRAVDMGAALHADGTLARLAKALPSTAVAGEYVGLARVATAHTPAFAAVLRARMEGGGSTGCYEDALTALAALHPLGVVWTPRPGMWIDIDTPHDLAVAQGLTRDLS